MRNNAKKNELNISSLLEDVITDIAAECPSFSHIEPDKLLVCIATNRGGSRGATFGKLVPLRFEKGSRILNHHGRLYSIPEIHHNGKKIRYLIYFYMPRFFDLPVEEKIRVIFHELYHISADFDGDIRRMGKVKKAHGHSRKHFDSNFEDEQIRFTSRLKEKPYLSVLSMNTAQLKRNWNRITGRRMKVPKPVRLEHVDDRVT